VTGLMVFADSLVHGHPPSGLKRLPDYDTPRRRGKEAVLFALTLVKYRQGWKTRHFSRYTQAVRAKIYETWAGKKDLSFKVFFFSVSVKAMIQP